MRKILCWLLGHDCMTTSARRRVCLRCGLREMRRNYGNVLGWEEVGETVSVARGADLTSRAR